MSAQLRSVVNAGTLSRAARARQALSASERPSCVVSGRRRATCTQSASVIPSISRGPPIKPCSRYSSSRATGSPPRSATFERTSAQFTTLIADRPAKAAATVALPFSAWISAINADASNTEVGELESAAATALFGPLGRRLRTTVCDQLVRQIPIRRQVRDAALCVLDRSETLLCLGGSDFGRVGHVLRLPPSAANSRLPA